MSQATFASDEYVVRRGSDLSRFERWASLATATAAVAYGVIRRSVPGIVLAVAATPLASRGIAGKWPRIGNGRARDDTRVALSGTNAIHVRESIRLEKPVGEVFCFWRRLENLPRFISHLERVTEIDDRHSRWVAKGPGGFSVTWDAEIINEVENKIIAWRSLPGSDVVSAGSVLFSTARQGQTTQVAVHLQYAPPAGRAGATLAGMSGMTSQMIREDLRHVKQLLEAGEIPHGAGIADRGNPR